MPSNYSRTSNRRVIYEQGCCVAATTKRGPWWELQVGELTEDGRARRRASMGFARACIRMRASDAWASATLHERSLMALALVEGFSFDGLPWTNYLEIPAEVGMAIGSTGANDLFGLLEPLPIRHYADLAKHGWMTHLGKVQRQLAPWLTAEDQNHPTTAVQQ